MLISGPSRLRHKKWKQNWKLHALQRRPESLFQLRLHSCSKILNPGPATFQIWESDSCSESGYYQPNRNLPMFVLRNDHARLLLLPKLKSNTGPGSVVFTKFLLRHRIWVQTKRRILPELTPGLRILSHLWSEMNGFKFFKSISYISFPKPNPKTDCFKIQLPFKSKALSLLC